MTTPSARLALFTVVYPDCERFLSEWWQSVLGQTDPNFDIWVSIDGVPERAVKSIVTGRGRVQYMRHRRGLTPASIRDEALSYLCNKYDAVVMSDSDDVLMTKRMELTRQALFRADLVGCALNVIDENGGAQGVIFGEWDDSQTSSLLLRWNVFGLSNTAFSAELLGKLLPIPADCLLIDWLLATRAAALGAVLHFDAEPQMQYRQYTGNTARVMPPWTADEVLRATRLVENHYSCLLGSGGDLISSWRDKILKELGRVRRFAAVASSSTEILTSYVRALNALPPRFVWWWIVANSELEEIWTQS